MAGRDYTRAEVIQIVADAARNNGIPQDDFLRAAYIETGGHFNEKAYNEGSRAAGLFQFLPSTAEQYGIRGREFDPVASADAAARFYLDNQRSIVQGHVQSGRPYLSGESTPNGLDMYVAHQQGAAGYRSIQAAIATGAFSRGDTRGNILSNISSSDARALTGHSMSELRGMPDGDLARSFTRYWDAKYDRIAIPEQQIVPRTGGAVPATPGQPAPTETSEPVLRLNAQGDAVTRLQQQLVDHGVTQPDGQPLAVDGRFGPNTDAAVRRFQSRAGLEADGVVGPRTRGALNDPALADGVLRLHEKGPMVQRLQERLIEAGITDVQGRPFRADGLFGPQTQAAVETYQRQHGLGVDGVAGPRTLDALSGVLRAPDRTVGAGQPQPATGDGPRWPAPGNFQINEADKAREGRGEFGTPRSNRSGIHSGLDIQGNVGDPIKPYLPGRVLSAGQDPNGYGNYIVIEHANRTQTVYAHLDSMAVRAGDTVTADQTIGTMGRSGNTPARGDTHLHFELRENATPGVKLSGTPVDPLPHLRAIGREPQRAAVSPGAGTVPSSFVAQQSQVSGALAERLGGLGYGAAQIDSITGAMAAANARDGEMLSPGTRFLVGKDGQRVAAQYANGTMREVEIPSALQQTGAQHLQAAAQTLEAGQGLTGRNSSAMVVEPGERGRAVA